MMTKLNLNQRRVFNFIFHLVQTDSTGKTKKNNAYIAKALFISEGTVGKAIKKLEEIRYLKRSVKKVAPALWDQSNVVYSQREISCVRREWLDLEAIREQV